MVEHHENAKNEQKCGVQNQYDPYTLGLDFMTYSTCFRYFSQVLPLPLLSCESQIFVKENPYRKKRRKKERDLSEMSRKQRRYFTKPGNTTHVFRDLIYSILSL